jgi:hypothetical protein
MMSTQPHAVSPKFLASRLAPSVRALPLWATLIVTWMTCSARASAQEQDDPAVIGAARALAVDGVKLAQSDRCNEAIDKLERAEKLHHAPIVLTRLGECYIKLGRLVEGVESLRAVLREPLPSNPSEALTQAYVDAKTLFEANNPRLANLTVNVEGAAADAGLSLTIDGRSLPAALIGTAHPSDPGEHEIQIAAPGYVTSTRKVTLTAGEEQTVTLTMTAAPERTAEHVAASSALDTKAADADALKLTAAAGGASHLPAYISWGAGAVGLGLGVGFGIAAMNNKSDLDARCPAKACPPSERGLLDTSRKNATISTIGYGVALAGAAAGVVLFLLEGRAPEQQTVSARADGVSVRF